MDRPIYFQDIDYRGLFLAAGLLAISVLSLISYKKQQRRIRSGKESARGGGCNENGLWVVDLPFHIAKSNKWCRIAAHFDFVAKSKEGFLERFELTRHCFKLSLRDRTGRVIVNETRPFQDFATSAWSRRKEVSLTISAQSTLHCHGDGVPILEFVAPHPGDYRLTFEIPAEETIKDGCFEYESKLEYFTLSVREDVLPMRSLAYPHKKLDLRQAKYDRDGR